ncbi:unnamed protein product [Scytosiphon promiscuus]
MAKFMRLAAVLTACLPASGFVWSPVDGGASRLQQRSTRGRSVFPLAAYVKGNEGAAQLREALVTSDAFEDLVKRLEEKTQHSSSASRSGADGISDESGRVAAAPAAPAAVSQPGAAPAAVVARGHVSDSSADHSHGADDAWKDNTEKLAALRTTVLQSPKAREMREKIVNGNNGGEGGSAHSNSSTTAVKTPGTTVASSSSSASSTAAEADAATSDAWAVSSQEQGPEASSSIAAAAAATAAPDAPTPTAGEEDGEQEGRGARRFRWVGRLASKVSNVGRRIRGRAARNRADDAATQEEQSL